MIVYACHFARDEGSLDMAERMWKVLLSEMGAQFSGTMASMVKWFLRELQCPCGHALRNLLKRSQRLKSMDERLIRVGMPGVSKLPGFVEAGDFAPCPAEDPILYSVFLC
jgi:hypothetical protein